MLFKETNVIVTQFRKLSMYAHFSNSILLYFHYLQRQMNGLAKLQLAKLSHHRDTALGS